MCAFAAGYEEIIKGPIKRPFLGFEPSGKLHLGHYLVLKNLKLVCEKNNIRPVIYVADYHAVLNDKSEISRYAEKSKIFMKNFFKDPEIYTGAEVFNDPAYLHLFNEFLQKINLSEVTKGVPVDLRLKNTNLSEKNESIKLKYLIYVIYQALDVKYFGCDTVFCGLDQRKVYAFAYDIYQKLKWPKFNLFLYPLISEDFKIGVYGEKMSSSKNNCIYMDKLLYDALHKHLHQTETLNPAERKIISTLCKHTDASVLKLYGVTDNTKFLQELYCDTLFLKDFSWQ